MARYELSDGKSNKFWEIKLEGAVLTTTFGRIGTAGQSSTKVLGSPAAAKSEHDKLVAEKTKKGYALVAAAAASTAPAAGQQNSPLADLEARIIACPDDEDAWRAYGEALAASGDVRGEVVILSLEAGGKPPAAAKKIVEANSKKWLGELAKAESLVALTWKYGAFIDTARVRTEYDAEGLSTDQQIRALLRLESAKFLRELTIGLADAEGDNDYGASLTAIAKAGMRPSLRMLFVGDFEQEESEISWSTIGDVGRVLPVLPNLEELRVKGGKIGISSLALPCLTKLTLHTGGLPGATARAVAGAKLPELSHLEVWFGSSEYGATADIKAITPLFDGKGFPKLTHLGLMNSEFENDIAKSIARSKILAQLQSLDLSMGTMTDEGAEAILAAADRFSHLSSLNLEDNYLSEQMGKKLKKALPNAVVGSQRSPSEWGGETHYYVSVGE